MGHGLRVGGHPALSLHSSNEPRELSEWLAPTLSWLYVCILRAGVQPTLDPYAESFL